MKKWLFFFAVLTLINVTIFFFRDSFQYVKYSTYADLYGECKADCRKKWSRFLGPFSTSTITEARTLLLALPLDTSSTLSSLRQIGQHFYQRFYRQAGDPRNNQSYSDPVDLYNTLPTDTTQKLWCGTWAQMLSFFGWSQNIISRNVEIMRPGDHHVLNEWYLPEQKQWVMMDLTHNIVWAEKEGRLLNAQTFVQALSDPDSVTVLTGKGIKMSLDQMPQWPAVRAYYQTTFPYYYYHLTKPEAVYTAGAKWKRYFLPDSWYEIFSPSSRIAGLFFVKLFFIAVWMITGSLILVKGNHDRSKRPTEKFW